MAADAAMIQQIQGNGGGDDNFLLACRLTDRSMQATPPYRSATSRRPTAAASTLAHFGGTALATASPQQDLQVLTPAPSASSQIGQQDNITWQTGGLVCPS